MADDLSIGTVSGNEIAPARNTDGTYKVRKLQGIIAGGTKSMQLFGMAGVDYCPQNGARFVKMQIGINQTAIIATSDKITPVSNPGEIEVYSYDASWVKKARFKCKVNGKIFAGNATTDLLTIMIGLIDQIKAITTAGSPGAHVVDPTAQAALENYKIQIRALLDSAS